MAACLFLELEFRILYATSWHLAFAKRPNQRNGTYVSRRNRECFLVSINLIEMISCVNWMPMIWRLTNMNRLDDCRRLWEDDAVELINLNIIQKKFGYIAPQMNHNLFAFLWIILIGNRWTGYGHDWGGEFESKMGLKWFEAPSESDFRLWLICTESEGHHTTEFIWIENHNINLKTRFFPIKNSSDRMRQSDENEWWFIMTSSSSLSHANEWTDSINEVNKNKMNCSLWRRRMRSETKMLNRKCKIIPMAFKKWLSDAGSGQPSNVVQFQLSSIHFSANHL